MLRKMIAAGRAGDPGAFDWLVRQYQDMVYAVAYSRLGDHHLAEDAAQATFVEALVGLDSLREPAAFPAWLRQIAISKCHRLFRKKRLDGALYGRLPEVAADDSDHSERLGHTEAMDSLHLALMSLAEPDREILTLFYIRELSVRDISVCTEISEAAVKKRLHTARKRLKERTIRMMKEDVGRHRPSKDQQFAEGVRDMLLQLCRDGFEKHFPDGDPQARRRWAHEARQLDERMGLSYWEVAWRMVRFMQERDIPFGPGRGRVPLSLLAYLLGVSRINPLEFGLSFAREANPKRPFIGLDVCWRRIGEAAAFLEQTWPGRVARFDRWPKARYREFLVTPKPLETYGLASTTEGLGLPLVEAGQCERLGEAGSVSIALIGSRTVTHVAAALKKIEVSGTKPPDLNHLDWNDPEALALLGEGALDETLDVLDWNVMVRRKVLRKIRPESFEELMAGLALLYQIRKNPAVLAEYVRRKKGRAAREAPHPILQPILQATRGILLYDEQFAAVLRGVAGWEMWSPQMWDLQEAVRQRDEQALATHREAFLAGGKANGVRADDAAAVWEFLLSNNAWYCKAAAVGYAVLIFQAAYLKAHFPGAFDAAAAQTPVSQGA